MSHAIGCIKFRKDDLIMYYDYNGTADIVNPTLFEKVEDCHLRHDGWNKCECGGDEDVDIYTTYGFGTYWEGRACRKCMAILPPLSSEDFWEKEQHGKPSWSPFPKGY